MSDAPATPHRIVNPETVAKPIGYANGVLAAPGRTLFLSGDLSQLDELGEGGLVPPERIVAKPIALNELEARILAVIGRRG